MTFLSEADGTVTSVVATDHPATGLAEVTGIDDPELYVANGDQMTVVRVGGTSASDPAVTKSFPMPGDVRWVVYNVATQMVHVLGDRQDGTGSTVYVIEPHGDAVYADAPLPAEPSAWALDAAKPYPGGRPRAAPDVHPERRRGDDRRRLQPGRPGACPACWPAS